MFSFNVYIFNVLQFSNYHKLPKLLIHLPFFFLPFIKENEALKKFTQISFCYLSTLDYPLSIY